MKGKVVFYLFLLINSVLFGQKSYFIKGVVTDEHDGAPLLGVSVLVTEAKLGSVTDENGVFTIKNIPKGSYQVRFSYMGHGTKFLKITVPSDESQNIKVALTETAIRMNDVVITGNPFISEDKELIKPLLSLSNLDLDIVRNNSIGEMLNYQAGVSVISNGTAVSRPVIRGFGSNRVLILEDGLRMGDLSGSSSDHSVTEDGSNPDKIEIIRGASSLLYTSSSPGGVINIITDLIPSNIPNKFNGSLSFGGNSVSDQKFANAELFYGFDRTSFDFGSFYRKSNSYSAPSGSRISNSDQDTKGLRGGISFHPQWGIFGLGVNTIKNVYGIPYNVNETNGEGPVYIDLNKTDYKALLKFDSLSNNLSDITVKAGYQDYKHSEISRLTQETGSKFSLSTFSSDISVKHNLFSFPSNINSAFGLSLINQKYNVRGEEALTPDANLSSIAFYLFEQLEFHPVNIQGAIRFEHNSINMPEAVLSDSLFPSVDKKFNSFSASLNLNLTLSEEISLFTTLSEQLRNPSVEELGSFSIHPAMGSFDIGNRNLTNEKNLGFEVGLRSNAAKYSFEANGYYNYINNYIFRNPSSNFYNNGKLFNSSGIPIYYYTQTNAEIYGAELKGMAELFEGISLTLTGDFVRGKYIGSQQNLPLIPPIRLTIEPKYVTDHFWLGVIWKGAAEQNHVAENESPTKGFGIVDLYCGVKLITGNLIHQIDLKVENLGNIDYREHLSALKNFAPMPGRNILISYKLLF